MFDALLRLVLVVSLLKGSHRGEYSLFGVLNGCLSFVLTARPHIYLLDTVGCFLLIVVVPGELVLEILLVANHGFLFDSELVNLVLEVKLIFFSVVLVFDEAFNDLIIIVFILL